MPIYPGSTTNITLYPTTPTELNIALYPAPTPAGGIALVQSASGTTADGSAGLPVSFGVPCTAGNSVLSWASFDSNNGFTGNPTLVGGGASVLSNVVTDHSANTTAIWVKTNVTGGESGVTCTTTDAVRLNNIIAEYSGLADAAAEDTATSSATSTTLAIGTITPTSANNLLTAIFAFNADVTAVGIANDVLVTGIGAGVYTCRGTVDNGDGTSSPYYILEGQPSGDPGLFSITWNYTVPAAWAISDGDYNPINTATGGNYTLPTTASWTGSTVTEIPGWELVGTRTGGSSVWEYVYQKIQTTATPSNPTIVLSGSCDIAGAGACFGGT